jgi:hypothetical protein
MAMAEHVDVDKIEIGGDGGDGDGWNGVERRVDNKPKLFGVSLANAIQIIVMAVTIGAILITMRQDMTEMKTSMESNNTAHHEIMMKLVEVQAHIVAMQDQMIYNRDRLDEAILDRARIKKSIQGDKNR